MGYPVLLHVAGRRALIVGGGGIAERKALDLLAEGAQVVVISPALTDELRALALGGRVTWVEGVYSTGQLAGISPFVAFAATGSPSVNAQIAAEAEALGVPVNRVDLPDGGSFSNMSALRRGHITVGVSTGGASPALAAALRARIDDAIGEEIVVLTNWLAELRPQVSAALPDPSARRALWRAIVISDALAHLRAGDIIAARASVDAVLRAVGLTFSFGAGR